MNEIISFLIVVGSLLSLFTPIFFWIAYGQSKSHLLDLKSKFLKIIDQSQSFLCSAEHHKYNEDSLQKFSEYYNEFAEQAKCITIDQNYLLNLRTKILELNRLLGVAHQNKYFEPIYENKDYKSLTVYDMFKQHQKFKLLISKNPGQLVDEKLINISLKMFDSLDKKDLSMFVSEYDIILQKLRNMLYDGLEDGRIVSPFKCVRPITFFLRNFSRKNLIGNNNK